MEALHDPLQIAVFGIGILSSDDDPLAALAYAVGEEIARAGALLVCGGRGGVMDAACRGARSRGGTTLGILPGTGAADSSPNEHLSVRVFTGTGQARNLAVALSAHAAVAIGGGWGTLSEIALALKHGVPVVTLAGRRPERPDGVPEPRLHAADDAPTAVRMALELGRGERRLGAVRRPSGRRRL
ncbi:MAG: TIGR00725 family protein [Acidobacteriota bacterium]